jgi:hypothetical protein
MHMTLIYKYTTILDSYEAPLASWKLFLIDFYFDLIIGFSILFLPLIFLKFIQIYHWDTMNFFKALWAQTSDSLHGHII